MIDHSFLIGKTAIVTGGAGGIGKEICARLAELGINIAAVDMDAQRLDALTEKITSMGGNLFTIAGDLTDFDFQDEMLKKVKEHFGSIDILVNCAGLAHHNPFTEVTPELFDSIMKVNVRTPYFLIQKAIPYLSESDCATIVNICSSLAHDGYPDQSVYAASKHALLGFSKSFANELYQKNIRVHCISPGAVFTDMVALTRPDLTSDGMTVPQDVADAISYFLHMRKTNSVIDEIRLHRVTKSPHF